MPVKTSLIREKAKQQRRIRSAVLALAKIGAGFRVSAGALGGRHSSRVDISLSPNLNTYEKRVRVTRSTTYDKNSKAAWSAARALANVYVQMYNDLKKQYDRVVYSRGFLGLGKKTKKKKLSSKEKAKAAALKKEMNSLSYSFGMTFSRGNPVWRT